MRAADLNRSPCAVALSASGVLGISERTVEAACAQLFRTLGLEPSPDVNRRVLAVLTVPRS